MVFAVVLGPSSHGLGRVGGGVIKRLKGMIGPAMVEIEAPSGFENPVVCLTHDLDWAECWRALESLVEMELAAGMRSTINVLIRGPYRISRQMLRDLEKEGFEIGLHGLWHDPALGMRKPEKIREFLIRAKEELGLAVKGFRAPAFSFSPRLAQELVSAGFSYDSSLPAWWNGVGLQPWKMKGSALMELPVWASDDRLLRERAVAPRQAARMLVELAMHGRPWSPAVLNLHPGLSMAFRGFVSELLGGLVEAGARVVGAAAVLGLEE